MTTPFDYIPAVLDRAVEDAQPIDVKGKVVQVVGTIVKASVPGVKIGEICILRNPWEEQEVQAAAEQEAKEAHQEETAQLVLLILAAEAAALEDVLQVLWLVQAVAE